MNETFKNKITRINQLGRDWLTKIRAEKGQFDSSDRKQRFYLLQLKGSLVFGIVGSAAILRFPKLGSIKYVDPTLLCNSAAMFVKNTARRQQKGEKWDVKTSCSSAGSFCAALEWLMGMWPEEEGRRADKGRAAAQ